MKTNAFSALATALFSFPIVLSSTQALQSEQSRFLLNGNGGEGTDYSLLIAVEGSRAKIAVVGSGCLGSMDASFSRLDRTTWILTSIGDSDVCQIVMKEGSNNKIETAQGPNCSTYHGAICGFGGVFEAPTRNGLSPIFDHKG